MTVDLAQIEADLAWDWRAPAAAVRPWCPSCRQDRPARDFAPSVVARGSGYCRDCYRTWQRARRAR